jgi:hypothetical protein
MKQALIPALLLVALLTLRFASVFAQQKISARDFVRFVFHQLDALTDHHVENASDCVKSASKCAEAMTKNLQRDDDTLASLDKMAVPGCVKELRADFRELVIAHKAASAAYARVLQEPRASEADLKKVQQSQRRERVEMVATLDAIVSQGVSTCGDEAPGTMPFGIQESR